MYYTIGLQVTASTSVFVVGEVASITCNTDLDIEYMEWLQNGQVVVSSTGYEVQLSFNPVNDTIHNKEYTCRATSPYGIQEESVSVITQSKCLCAFSIPKGMTAVYIHSSSST